MTIFMGLRLGWRQIWGCWRQGGVVQGMGRRRQVVVVLHGRHQGQLLLWVVQGADGRHNLGALGGRGGLLQQGRRCRQRAIR